MKKEKIKNIISEVRVGILSFIKNNKYLSLGIALFAIIGIVAGFVVFAANDPVTADVKELIVSSNVIEKTNENSTTYEADSFSDIIFNISYKLENPSIADADVPVTITAEIPEEIDNIEWKLDGNAYNYEYVDNNKRKIKITSSVPANRTINDVLILKLGNIHSEGEDIKTIDPIISVSAKGEKSCSYLFSKKDAVCGNLNSNASDDTNEESSDEIPQIIINGKETPLNPYLFEGYQHKAQDDSGRFVPIGIMLGIEKEQLKGKYINPNQSFLVETEGQQYAFDSNSTGIYKEELKNLIPQMIYSNAVADDCKTTFSGGDKVVNFTLQNLKPSVESPVVNIRTKDIPITNKDIYIFGSYYATYKVTFAEGVDSVDSIAKVHVRVNNSETIDERANITSYKTSSGSEPIDVSVDAEDIVNGNAILAYGEDLKVNFEYNLGIDADEAKNKTITIDIPGNDNLKLINYSSDITSGPVEILVNGEMDTSFDNKAYYDCKNNEITDITEGSRICKIEYTNPSVAPGTKINIGIRVESDDTFDVVETDDTSESYHTYVVEIGEVAARIKTVPYKARTKINYKKITDSDILDDSEVDITNSTKTVYGNQETQAALYIYPYLSAPGLLENSNALGIKNSKYNYVKVELPKGISYLPNETFNQPVVSVPTKVKELCGSECDSNSSNYQYLYYKFNTDQIGEYIEPIKVGISYDQNIENGEELKIKTKIISQFNLEGGGTIDSSPSSDLGTVSEGNLLYSISNSVLNSITAPNVIKKNSEFTVKVSVANRTSNDLTDVNLIVDMPSNNDSNYTGNIEYNFDEENVLCAGNDNDYKNCSEINEIEHVKYNISSVGAGDIINKEIIVKTQDNVSGDKYLFKSNVDISSSSLIVPGSSVIVKVQSPSISGTVWQDLNKNGYMDESEKKIDDVMLYLYKATLIDMDTNVVLSSELVGEPQISKNGKYSFSVEDENAVYYVVPEFNENKYGLTSYAGDVLDLRNRSSFKQYEEENLNNEVLSSDELEENDELQDDEDEDDISEDDKDEGDISEDNDSDEEKEYLSSSSKIRSNLIYINSSQKNVENINLGLTLREVFKVKLEKFVTSAITTNGLGISNTKLFENAKTAKLDVKNINSLSIKVVYTIKVKNIGYYPGIIKRLIDIIPEGMVFNQNYSENKGWVKSSDSDNIIEYTELANDKLEENEDKYITVAFDLINKNEGTYRNEVIINDDDISLYIPEEEGDE